MHMRIICLAAILAGCGGAPQSSPSTPLSTKKASEPAPVQVPQSDIRSELLATIVVGSLDSMLGVVSGYVAPALPAAFQPMLQPDALKAQLFKHLHVEELGGAVDTSRPCVIAFADPEVYSKGALGSAVLAIPLRDASAFVDQLGRMATRHESRPWKDRVFDFNGNALHCRVNNGWAFLASYDKLVNGAAATLLPLTGKSTPGLIHLSVDMVAIQARYGARLNAAAATMAGLLNKSGTASLVSRWLGYLNGMRELDLKLELQAAKIQATLSAQALAQGALRQYLDKLAVGEPWGAKYLPADSALLFLNRNSSDSRQQGLDDALHLLKAALGDSLDEATLGKLREALTASSASFGSESAVSLWVSGDGGIGVGGALAAKDAAAAQRGMATAMKLAGKQISELVQKKVPGGKLRVSLGVKPRALSVGGLKADLYELAITWPRSQDKKEREQIDNIKKSLTKLLGPKPTLAFVATGEVALLAFGKDHKKRLGELVAIAKGGTGTANEKLCNELANGRQVAMIFHSPLVNLAEGAMRVAQQLTTVPNEVREAINKALPGPGKTIPLTAIMHKTGDSVTWDVDLPPDLVASVAKLSLAFAAAPRQTSSPYLGATPK